MGIPGYPAGILNRYFFVGIIDRAAWDIARDNHNNRAAGPVRILHGIMTRPPARLYVLQIVEATELQPRQ